MLTNNMLNPGEHTKGELNLMDVGNIKSTNSPRTYKSGKHHRRLVCYKNSIDFPNVTGVRA